VPEYYAVAFPDGPILAAMPDKKVIIFGKDT